MLCQAGCHNYLGPGHGYYVIIVWRRNCYVVTTPVTIVSGHHQTGPLQMLSEQNVGIFLKMCCYGLDLGTSASVILLGFHQSKQSIWRNLNQ